MPIATDGFGTIVSTLEAGLGGGGIVIAPGGTISGSYTGGVLCQGNVTVTGATTVNGTLLVLGDLTNSGGHAMTIEGDFIVGNVNLDVATPGTPQGNLVVNGDMLFGDTFSFQQDMGNVPPADVYIGGDLMGTLGGGGTGNIYAEGGAAGSSGAHIYVNGSLLVYSVDVRGADSSTPGLTAGNGGEITVYGNVTVQNALYAQGGNGTNADAGNGGILTIWGNVNSGDASWNIHGGTGNTGNGGNGGDLYVRASVSIQSVYLYGGNCTSNSETHRSGSGGNVEIDGDFVCDSVFNARGGDRFGTLTVGNFLASPNGGVLYVYGSATFEDVFMEGGDVNTSGFTAHSGGHGGYFEVEGNVSVSDDFQLSGGYAQHGAAGNGGQVFVEGHMFIDDDLEMQGGNASNGNAGNGGNVDVFGHLQAGDCTLYGGNSNGGNGGNGGSVSVRDFTVDSYLEQYGGDCSSTNETHRAGNGGVVSCRNLNAGGRALNISGGLRSGVTTVPAVNPGPHAGSIFALGHIVCFELFGIGGSVATNFPNGGGGYGATIASKGSVVIENFMTLQGGNSVGPAGGGSGGNITVEGSARIKLFDGYGGGSYDSAGVGADAGRNGPGASGYFRDGVTCSSWNVVDGNGTGSASTGTVELILAGTSTFNNISMTDRVPCVIASDPSSSPAIVKVNAMSSKTTFNNHAGAATGDLSPRLGDSLFFSDSSGGWYYTQGTSI